MIQKKYWDPEIETMSSDALRKLQLSRLQEVVSRAYEKSNLYRQRFDTAGVKPTDINRLDDIKKLPLLEDAEFRATPLQDRLTVPISQIPVICSSGGTTGIPSPLPRTQRDWENNCIARQARARWTAGFRPGDIAQERTNYECTGAANKLIGVQRLTLCAGRGFLDNQIRLAQLLGVTIIVDVPSFALRYLDRARELGIDIKQTKIRAIWPGSETWVESYKKRLEARYGVTFLPGFYGASDTGGIEANECEYYNGYHIFADHVLFEIIDPETGDVLEDGQEGELVVTTLTLEALPLIRWRAGDITSILPYEPCPCGRTLPKMARVRGRIAQSALVKGKRIFPIDVEEVIFTTPGLGEEYQIIVDTPGEQDRLRVKAEYAPEVTNLKGVKEQVEEALTQALGVSTEVELVPGRSLEHAFFKAQRIITTYPKS